MMKLLNKPPALDKKSTEEERLNVARQAKIAERERSIKRGTVKAKEDHGLPMRYLQKTHDDSLERETTQRRESKVPQINIALRRPEKPAFSGASSQRELSHGERRKESRGRDKRQQTLFGNYQHKSNTCLLYTSDAADE